MTGHTLSQPLCAQDQDPEPLALREVASARCVNPCLANLLGMASCCTHKGPTDQCPRWHPSPFQAVFHRWLPSQFQAVFHWWLPSQSTRGSRSPSPIYLRLKTPMSPSSNQVDGKDHVSSPWMDHERTELITVNYISPRTSDPGHSPVPCTVLQLANAPTNQKPCDSLGDFSSDSTSNENTTAREPRGKAKRNRKQREQKPDTSL